MKYYIAIVLLTIVASASWGSNQESNPNKGFAGTHMHSGYGSRNAFKPANFRTTWHMDIKLSLLKEVGILSKGFKANQFDFIRDIFATFEEFPEEVKRIYMYGNGKSKNTTMLVFGDVSYAWLENYVSRKLKKNQKSSEKYFKKILRSGVGDVTKLTISEGNKERSIYFSNVTSGINVISSNIIELRRWIDYPVSVHYWNWSNTTSLLTLKMEIVPTLKNLQKKNDGTIYMLQSKIFKESSAINLVIDDDNESVFIGASISTKNKELAEELEQFIKDLFVNNSPENSQDIKGAFLKNLKIKNKGRLIKIASNVPKAFLNNNVSQ